MNIFLITQSITLIVAVVFAVRSHRIASEVIYDVSERINRCNKNVTMMKLKHEMVEAEFLKIQDKLGVLQRELYRKSKPKSKSKAAPKEKAVKKTAPDITVDAVAPKDAPKNKDK